MSTLWLLGAWMLKSLRTPEHRALRAMLREMRRKSGLKQRQLAALVDRKHQSFVSKVEIGERRLDVIEFIWIAQVLDIDPRVLLGELISRFPRRFFGAGLQT